MLNASVVSAFNIVRISLIESGDVEVVLVQRVNEVCVFDDENKFRRYTFQRIAQSFLILLGKIISVIVREFCIVWWIQKYKISLV